MHNQRIQTPLFKLIPICFLLSLFANGCDSPFPPDTLVQRPRLLALRADPPEANLTDTVSLEALVAFPDDKDQKYEATWAVCFFEFENIATDIPCPSPDSFMLAGNQLQTEFSLPAWIEWLEEKGINIDTIIKTAGIDNLPWILIGFAIEIDGVSMRAIKRVKLRLNDEQPANHNPEIEGILIDSQKPSETSPNLAPDQSYNVQPIYGEDSRETYILKDTEEPRQEDHLFSWFSTCGSFSDRRTIVDIDNQGNLLQNNQWKTDSQEETDLCSLWIVLRDGRYGVDWAEYQFKITNP